MYSQLVAMNGSTVEMCRLASCGDRAGALEQQEITTWSTLEFNVENRAEVLLDELEIYRRGDTDAARPACCPPPFDVDNNWMTEYPRAYVIPLGRGQRSDPEANRLVQWLLDNGIEVERADDDGLRVGAQRFEEGSYVIWMDQPFRGLADTALGVGVDVSPRIFTLYAPPGAWSHGYLWGADIVVVPRSERFRPETERIRKVARLDGGITSRRADAYALEIDSRTAVRTVNALLGGGLRAELATEPFGGIPAGTVLFPAMARDILDDAGKDAGLSFRAIRHPLPDREPIDRVPRIAVLTGAVNQDVWSLRQLGFPADPVPTGTTSALNNAAGPNPLDNYDVVFNTAPWPAAPTSRARLTAFFNAGGGYIGALENGANFLGASASGQLAGLTPGSQTGGGQSGIFYWQNTGGAGSPIVGAYPSQDTLIMDPPTWFSTVPAGVSVDGHLLSDTTTTFASGLWRDPRSVSARGAPIIVHGTSTAPGSLARITAFAMNPLYRADPEREWPMVSEAAYWADQ